MDDSRKIIVSNDKYEFIISEFYNKNIDVDDDFYIKENMDYYFRLNSKNNEKIDLSILNDDKMFKNIRKIDDYSIDGCFNSNNYVGYLRIDFLKDAKPLIKIVSQKIDEDNYTKMMDDITDFFVELLSRASSIVMENRNYENYRENTTNKMYYSKLLYIEKILSDNNLVLWIEYLIHHSYTKLKNEKETRDIWEVENISPDAIIDALNDGKWVEYGKRVIPLELTNDYYIDTKDTKENQFVKFFIKILFFELNEIKKEIVDNALINELINKISDLLKLTFFNDISDISNVSMVSQVLQKRYPYNLIFRAYNYLKLIPYISSNISPESFYEGQKDVPKIYEYWTFFQVYNILNNLYEEIDNNWIQFSQNKLDVNLYKGTFSTFKIDNNYKLELYYNKEFKGRDKSDYETYSVNYDPDISLILYENNKRKSILLFDAKYKLVDSKEDNNDDLNKMHTYKEAIYNVVGAYALSIKDKMEMSKYYKNKFEYDNNFSSIGTISMIPGKYNKNEIEELIKKYIKIEKEKE